MLEILWEERALNELSKLDNSIASRIFKKIESLKEGFSGKDIKSIKGKQETYRLRVGDYRIIFKLTNNTIKIFMLGHRKNIYERF